MIDYPNKLNLIFDKLIKKAKKIIIVGGYVRDSILHINSKDIDIEVYGINTFNELEKILKEFGEVNSVGKSFGVCKLNYKNLDLDFSLPRRDNKVSPGYTGFDIEIDSSLDFKTAALRRDFTINAIGFDVIKKEILDPFNGLSDLKNKILRAVNNTSFIEDPLRILRAMQFCARFELKIDNNLLILCKDMIKEGMLNELPQERIYGEFKKLFLKSKKPSLGLNFLIQIDATKYFPYFNHKIDSITKSLKYDDKTNMVLVFTLLCYSHDLKEVQDFIINFTNDTKLIDRVLKLLKNLPITDKNILDDYTIYKLAFDIKISELLVVSKIIFGDIYNLEIRSKELNVLTKGLKPLIQGRDLLELGMKPSKEFSKILNDIYDAQMKAKFTSYEGAIKYLKSNHLQLSSDL